MRCCLTKLLLVEDTLDLARLIERELAAAGYDIIHTDKGKTALQLHTQHQPDVVILDWMLPDLDGLAVLREIRGAAATPILMLTSRDEEIDKVLGLEAGADDYLTKPFSMRELLARVRALLRRVELMKQTLQADQAKPGTAIHWGNLTLDPEAYLVTLDRVPVDLSRTEFNLLHLLLRNRGRTFGRDYLLETVWGDLADVSDRSVDNMVLRLRKKLGEQGSALETVWGVGYRWRRE